MLTLLAFDTKSAKIIRNTVPLELFDGDYRSYASDLYGYHDKYGAPPEDGIASLFETRLVGQTADSHTRDFITNLYEARGKVKSDFVLDQLQNFLRKQYLKQAIIESADLLQKGTDEALDEAETTLSSAFKKRLDLFDPGSFLGDTYRTFKFLSEEVESLPTGIKILDEKGLGPTYGGLHLFIGLPKRGKTWWMINLGRRAMVGGYKVCHVTLEMPEYQIAGRYYQTLFALAKRDKEIDQTKLDLGQHGELLGFLSEKVQRPFAFNDPRASTLLQRKIDILGKKINNVVVKQFPTGKLTCRQLEAYLDSLEEQQGFKPDLLIVDYADLMSISTNNYRLDLGRTYVDLRGIASERQIAVATASQSSRKGIGEGVGEATVAEDFSKIATADCVIAFDQTKEEKSLGLARLKVTNARSDSDNQTILITQNYTTGQFVRESWLMPTFEKIYTDKLIEYEQSQA